MKSTRNFLFLSAITLIIPTLVCGQAPVKKVLLEEYTTTLCGMCPPQSHAIKEWHEAHPSNSILMVHHAGFGTDAMTNSVNTTTCSYFQPSNFGFAPAILIDRDVYPWLDSVPYMSVNGFDTIADRVANEIAVVGVDIQGTFNSATGALSVTATATFSQNVASYNRRITIYLVEDSTIGSGSGWDQKCYDGNFANLHYPGQWNSSTDYISAYPHRYTVRAALSGGTWGSATAIPNLPVVGTPYSTTQTYTVPPTLNPAKLKIVAFVSEYGPNHVTRQVLNANDVAVASSFSTNTTSGFSASPVLSGIVASAYPNPTHDLFVLNYELTATSTCEIQVMNMQGQIILSKQSKDQQLVGTHQETLDISLYANGMYFVNVITETNRSTIRILKE